MARIRSVHPGIFTDEAFASVSRDARLLFIGLWCEADDSGVFEWKPLTLKMKLFPADGSDVNVGEWLEALADQDMIRWFEHDGRPYGAIRNFGRYQRPRTPKYLYPCPDSIVRYVAKDGVGEPGAMTHKRDLTASDRKRKQRENERERDADLAVPPAEMMPENDDEPAPDQAECHSLGVTDATNVTPFPTPLQQTAAMSRQMEEVSRKKGNSDPSDLHSCPKPPPKRARISYPADFERFWSEYPTDPNMSKKEAATAWMRLPPDDRQMAIDAIPRFRSFCAKQPTYRPVHACRFLSQRRFEGHMSAPEPGKDSRSSIFNRG